jgi:hypothetical protein
VISIPDTFNGQGMLHYAAYVDSAGLHSFPAKKYIYVRLPLPALTDLLKVTDARSVASRHGIAISSRCNAATLKSYVHDHSCSECDEYITVFSVEKDAATKHNDCIHKYWTKCSKAASQYLVSQKLTLHINLHAPTSFPPEPAIKDCELAIIRSACR